VRDLWDIYPVQPAGGTPSGTAYSALPLGALSPPQLARAQSGGSGGGGGGGGGGFDARLAAANGGAAAAALAIAGVPLEPSRVNATAQEPAQRERAAAALGYVAAAVELLEVILAVPLRYGVLPRGSRSLICDRADGAATAAALAAQTQAQRRGGSGGGNGGAVPQPPPARVWHPLYTEGCVVSLRFPSSSPLLLSDSSFVPIHPAPRGASVERPRFVHAVLLLNKDLEQLLNAFGLPAVGPRHTLANLARLCAPALRPRLLQPALPYANGTGGEAGASAQQARGAQATPPCVPLPPAGRREGTSSPEACAL
jgi:hypothetical protein